MNEVATIHLGRQAFTISVDAYHELKSYLDAIQKQVDDSEVINEIELRMIELLIEHGVKSNDVILSKDVDYLKEQLGHPADFKELDDETAEPNANISGDAKRLYRDTNNAMLAGVASGLSNYFGIDVLIVRLALLVVVFLTAGWGILLYIVLWLLVPEAKTPSERLMMAGKPVTVNSLKEIVENADVKAAAYRANRTLAGPIRLLFSIFLKILGIGFIVTGLVTIFSLFAAEAYYLSRGRTWLQYNIFPVGFRQSILLNITLAVAVLIGIIIILMGIAMFQRKWPVRNWITGVLLGVICIGAMASGVLAADVYPAIRDSYNANLHTTTYSERAFKEVNLNNAYGNVNQIATTYRLIIMVILV
jgi:phage shock protein PspC (stress-responsive transcriptional regulator)